MRAQVGSAPCDCWCPPLPDCWALRSACKALGVRPVRSRNSLMRWAWSTYPAEAATIDQRGRHAESPKDTTCWNRRTRWKYLGPRPVVSRTSPRICRSDAPRTAACSARRRGACGLRRTRSQSVRRGAGTRRCASLHQGTGRHGEQVRDLTLAPDGVQAAHGTAQPRGRQHRQLVDRVRVVGRVQAEERSAGLDLEAHPIQADTEIGREHARAHDGAHEPQAEVLDGSPPSAPGRHEQAHPRLRNDAVAGAGHDVTLSLARAVRPEHLDPCTQRGRGWPLPVAAETVPAAFTVDEHRPGFARGASSPRFADAMHR